MWKRIVMDYKDYLSGFGKGISKDLDSFRKRTDSFLKKYQIVESSEENGDRPSEKFGILMTDITKLAEKFSIKAKDAERVLNEYREGSALVGIHWDILNATHEDYDYVFQEEDSWKAYSKILTDFMLGMGITPSGDLGLFIIGGDDVIPMPSIDCPLPGLTTEPLDADYLYCFELEDLQSGNLHSPRCNVGRLPLENGNVDDGLELIEEYFNRSLAEYDGIGMDIEKGVMTTTESWLPSSREMIRNLPIDDILPEYGCTEHNMFVSPQLDSDSPETQDKFNGAISEADFLMFNLHGSDDYEHGAYYGEDMYHSCFPEAFTKDNIRFTNAKIINSTACYGGRYVNYNRGHSMLLQGIFGCALLYTASCTTALGRGNGFSEATDLIMPAGMSETLMKLYTIYLYRGMNAGEALMKAKEDYIRTCINTDGRREAFSTIYMFNLYGNPLLNMKPRIEEERFGNYIPKIMTSDNKSINDKVETGLGAAISSVANDVREAVDSSLDDIKSTIMDTLYKDFGLVPDELSEMDTIVIDGEEKGYMLTYTKKGGPFNRKVFAKTDLAGKVVDIIHTK